LGKLLIEGYDILYFDEVFFTYTRKPNIVTLRKNSELKNKDAPVFDQDKGKIAAIV
jgi:hypothetical protein